MAEAIPPAEGRALMICPVGKSSATFDKSSVVKGGARQSRGSVPIPFITNYRKLLTNCHELKRQHHSIVQLFYFFLNFAPQKVLARMAGPTVKKYPRGLF